MTEKGNDELLAEVALADVVDDGVAIDDYERAAEETRVEMQVPADDEGGTQYPDPDTAP